MYPGLALLPLYVEIQRRVLRQLIEGKDDMGNDARRTHNEHFDEHCLDERDGVKCLARRGHGGDHVGVMEERTIHWSNEPPAENAFITCIASDLTDSHVWSRTAPPRRAGTDCETGQGVDKSSDRLSEYIGQCGHIVAGLTLMRALRHYDDWLKTSSDGASPQPAEPSTFPQDLARIINHHYEQSASGTPDFILAGFIADSLRAFNSAINQRTIWYEADRTSRGGVSA